MIKTLTAWGRNYARAATHAKVVLSIVRNEAGEVRFETLSALLPTIRQSICGAVDILLAFSRENAGSR